MREGSREVLATAWVAPLTFFTHALSARPELVGVWADDAVYFDLGESLARGDGLRVGTLPLTPEAAKYPVGWPLLLAALFRAGVDPHTDGGARVVLLLNALLWAIAAQVAVSGVMPALGASRTARVLAGLLLAVNVGTAQIAVTGMSEALFAMSLTVAVALAMVRTPPPAAAPPSEPSLARVAGLALAVAVACLARSIGGPLAIAGVALALVARRWSIAAAVGAGWACQAVIDRVARATTTLPDGDALRVLHYYVSYDEHVRFYTALAGDPAALLARVAHVVTLNATTAPRALGMFLFPSALIGAEEASGAGTAGAGIALLAMAALGATRLPNGRWLAALLALYTAFYLGWTWPFASRFWLPAFPLLVALALTTLPTLGNIGRLLTIPIAGLILAGHVAWFGYGVVRLATPPEGPSPGEDPRLSVLATRVAPGDVLLGPQWVMWAARRVGTQGLEAESLLPADDRLGMILGLVDPGADARRLADELDLSLAALARVRPDAAVWLVTDPTAASAAERRMAPLYIELAGRGRLLRAAVAENILLLRVAPPPP